MGLILCDFAYRQFNERNTKVDIAPHSASMKNKKTGPFTQIPHDGKEVGTSYYEPSALAYGPRV